MSIILIVHDPLVGENPCKRLKNNHQVTQEKDNEGENLFKLDLAHMLCQHQWSQSTEGDEHVDSGGKVRQLQARTDNCTDQEGLRNVVQGDLVALPTRQSELDLTLFAVFVFYWQSLVLCVLATQRTIFFVYWALSHDTVSGTSPCERSKLDLNFRRVSIAFATTLSAETHLRAARTSPKVASKGFICCHWVHRVIHGFQFHLHGFRWIKPYGFSLFVYRRIGSEHVEL